MRGQLTEELKEDLRIRRSLRDREITLTELRLYPYMLYLATNNGKIEREKVTPKEMSVIKDYVDKGWLKIEPRVKPNEFLWDLMNYVVYKAYVIYDEKEEYGTTK